MHDMARRRAQQLRSAAIADFWHGVYRLGAHALRAPQRASTTPTRTRTRIATVSHHPSGV
jgi:hypothetical protein